MGILPRGGAVEGKTAVVGPVGLAQMLGVRAGVNEHVVRYGTGLALRQRANMAGRHKRERCCPRAGENGGCGGGSAVTAS